MKIVIPGGSGQVGKVLARTFVADGHEVVVLSRRPRPTLPGSVRADAGSIRHVEWNGEMMGRWANEFDGADVVINLAGRSVNCRYGIRNRREIKESRVMSTRAVGQAIAEAARPPRVWLQASTATIYAHRYDAPNDETTGLIGGNEPNSPETWRFSIDVAKSWEQAALEAVTPKTRLVLLRSAITMSPDRGGAFDYLLRLVRWGLGGKHGDGRQFVSWIHDRDFVRAIYWLIEHDLSGPINLASPNPLPNVDFMRQLQNAWGIRIGLPATEWMLEVGTFLMRSESELVLKSRRVIPGRLSASGFEFVFPTWAEAAQDLCDRWRGIQRPDQS